MSLINQLEEDLKRFENYRIPSNFFGLGAQTVDYINGVGGTNNLIESLSDVNFIINASNKGNIMNPLKRKLLQSVF